MSFVFSWFFTEKPVAESDKYFFDFREVFNWSEYEKWLWWIEFFFERETDLC